MKTLDALGNPIRRDILELLAQEPRSVGQLALQVAHISRPAVSRHLAVLEGAGLVRHESSGTRNIYSLRPEGFDDVRSYLVRFWDDSLPRFVLVAENLQDEQ